MSKTKDVAQQLPRSTFALLTLAILCIAGHAAAVRLSLNLEFASADISSPTTQYITLAIALAIVVLALTVLIPKLSPSPRNLILIFLVGLSIRVLMFASVPVLEDDWHRYLWDGAVVAHGGDPYEFSPAEATPLTRLGEPPGWAKNPELLRLQKLTEENFDSYWEINYPYLKTIYPPLAQAAFALGYSIKPYQLNGWRAVLLITDLVNFSLLILALHLYGRSPLYCALYWWNPVITLEVFNSAHMDGLIVPFLLGALVLAKLHKHRMAVVVLAGAVAVKLWPVLLFPAFAQRWLKNPLQLASAVLLFTATALLMLWPQLRHVMNDPEQGLVAYALDWQRHAFVFHLLTEQLARNFTEPDRLARMISAVAVISAALWWGLGQAKDSRTKRTDLPRTLLLITVTLLLLAPTGYPWYQVWIACFIPFAPRWGALALMVTSSLYYARFISGDSDPFYREWLVPIAFGIPLLLFITEAVMKKRA